MNGRRDTRGGFTLIEIMAVVMIFALLAAFVAPQIGGITGRALTSRANDVGAQLQLARERAILTGTPHRVLFDLEDQSYRLEWWQTDAQALGEEEEEALPEQSQPVVLVSGGAPLELAAPRQEERSWHPLPGKLGSFERVEDGLSIVGVETAGEYVERGDVGLAFEWDGTTAPAFIFLDDETQRRLRIEVLPLADGVRIEHVE